MNKAERYTRYAMVVFTTMAVLLLGASMVSAEHGVLPQEETEPVTVIETNLNESIEETTEEVTEEPEPEAEQKEEEIIYEEETEDYGSCDDVVAEDEEPIDLETEWCETYEDETSEHECNTWINESEFDNGMHVWECEECGATEFWEWFDEELDDFDPDDHECTEFTPIDEDGYYYCVECEAGYFEE